MNYLNLSLKQFEDPGETDTWYNLETNRKITKKKKDYIFLNNPNIAGKPKTLIEFFKLNNISLPLILNEYLSNSPKIISHQFNDIEDISIEQLEMLNAFSFQRMCCKAKVDRVIDGDTIDLFILIPFSELISLNLHKSEGLISNKCNMLCNKSDVEAKFIFKVRCRLFGIDTADIDLGKKEAGKKYLKSLIEECNSIVYCRFLGRELHGRELADIFEDCDYKINICMKILEYNDPEYGKLAYPYFGGTKIKH